MLRPVVGWHLDGATLGAVDEIGGVGSPAWGPRALVRDLELRLGLLTTETATVLRLERWMSRLRGLLPREPFYARSFVADPLGSATVLLAWRDGLVDGGWDGSAVPDGGARLDAMARVEALHDPPMLPGWPERLARIERALASETRPIYTSVELVEDRSTWPTRWRRVFDRLESRGTIIASSEAPAPDSSASTDLARLQRLVAMASSERGAHLRGDGSVVLLDASTTLRAADAVAAILRHHGPERAVVILGGGEELALEEALVAQGLGAIETTLPAPSRGAALLLPLTLELLFDPPDPHRALDLLTIPAGPLAGIAGYMMSRALGEAPGIGGPRWNAAKARLRERVSEHDGEDAAARLLALVEEWLESPRFARAGAAPRDAVIATVARVRELLRVRLATSERDPVTAAAFEQCDQLRAILETDGRAAFDVVAVRQLVDLVTIGGVATAVAAEEAGRVDHVDHPGALLRRRDVVVWWHFVGAAAKLPAYQPWRAAELAALARVGVHPPDPARLLAADARHYRRALLAARERLVLVAPRYVAGEAATPHPFWDEIVARLGTGTSRPPALVRSIDDLLAGRVPAVEELPHHALPPARPAWRVAVGSIAPATEYTPAALEALLECPLRWVLARAARVRAVEVAAIPNGSLLNGRLGHRLVQRLVERGAFGGDTAELEHETAVVLDELLPHEGAPLLQPGQRFELCQLRDQLGRAMRSLHATMRLAALAPVAVEEEIEIDWLDARLEGRLDLRLRDAEGGAAVLDLKWGLSSYRTRLEEGRAVQLAAYARASAANATGYFSLSRGSLLTTSPERFARAATVVGPSVTETIERIERTVPAVRDALAAGHVPVTGVRRALPLLDTLSVAPEDRASHFQCDIGKGCDRCGFPAICGKAWEGLT